MKKLFTLCFLMALVCVKGWGQVSVFGDDFNRAVLSPGGTPSMTYTPTLTSGATASTVSNSYLSIVSSNSTSGVSYVSGTTSTFSSPYNTTLSSNTNVITWTFNFRWNKNTTNPAAPASGNYGQAIVLAASTGIFGASGTGYAIEYGNASTPDPIRLVSFSGGVTGTLTSIISSGVSDIANTNNYASVRVTYAPSTNTWALFLRDDGATAWSDPSTGVNTQIGSTVNSTYTGTALTNFGFLWSHATSATFSGDFDNFKVALSPYNPATFTATAASATQVNLAATANTAGNNIVVVYNTTGTFTTPSGAAPSAGGTFAGGTVVYKGAASGLTNQIGLTASTTYYYKVFSYDASNNYSPGSTATATTPCVAISSFPFTETFDASSTSLPCWTVSNDVSGGTYTWAATTADATHGVSGPQASTRFAYLNVYNASATYNSYNVTSVPFALDATAKQLSYYYYLGTGGYKGTTGSTGADPYPLTVQVSTNNGSTWTDVYNHTSSNSTFATSAATTFWTLNTINLAAYTNTTILVRFKSNSNFGSGFCNQAIDQVTVANAPTCTTPTIGTPTSITSTSASVSFTCTSCSPGNAYIIEYGSSGFTPGTGATAGTGGTVVNGTASPIAISGLTANTTYDVYVRQNCTISSNGYSANSGKATFTTLCTAAALPFTEAFTSTTFPPSSCWAVSNLTVIFRSTSNAYGVTGTGSAEFNFYSAASGNYDLTLPPLTATPANYQLSFDEAYATYSGENDQLVIRYSTDGGNTYTDLITYIGGTSGTLNTGGTVGSFTQFTPTATQWKTQTITLPTGTTNIIFRGVSASGNNLYVDNIAVKAPPACVAPTIGTPASITGSSASIPFTCTSCSPGNAYIIEYGASGFTPGTGATAGTGGTIVTGTASPITISGLSGTTTYDVYVRQNCTSSSNGYSANSTKATFTTTLRTATWVGTSSTDWNTASNWDNNLVPISTDLVVIAAATNQPVIGSATSAVAASITLNSGTTLAINGTLADGGAWTNNSSAAAVSGTGTVTLSGTSVIIGGSALTAFPNLTITGTISQGINTSVTGNYIQTGGTYTVTPGATAYTLTVSGNFTESAGTFNVTSSSATAGATVTVAGATSIFSILFEPNASNTASTVLFQANGNVTMTGSSTTTALDWMGGGTAGTLYPITFGIKGNFNWSNTTGRPYTSGSGSANGFTFNGTGTTASPQTITYSGSASGYGLQFIISLGTVAQLQSNIAEGANANPYSHFTVNGTLDAQTYIISGGVTGGSTSSGFFLNAGATLITKNTAGVTGTITDAKVSYDNTANYVFNGTAAQTTSFSNTTMANLTINNTASLTTTGVTNSAASTITGILTLTAGKLTTTTTNTVSVTNTATGAVTGGSASSYISGPLNWALANSTSYLFPVGTSAAYYPYRIVTTTGNSSPVVQVSATAASAGGSANGTTLSAISTSEYWKTTTISGTFTGGSLSLGRNAALGSLNAIGSSTILAGAYASLGGTVGTLSGYNSVNNSSQTGTIAAATPLYTVLAQAAFYTVTYNGNGNTSGTVPVDASSPYAYNATVTVLGNTGTLVKTGYTFSGWNTAANGSGTAYAPGATFSITTNTTLYAQYTINSYTLTYNGNTNTGGTAPSAVTQNYNTTTTVAGQGTLVKTGYTFTGWNTAADGSGTPYAAGSTFTFTANTTLYAQWTIASYTLSYDGNGNTGGTAPASVTQNYNTTIAVAGPGTLVKIGYTFTGWNTAADGSGTSYAIGSTFTFTANTTLYAQWSINSYTLSYDGNSNTGGTAPASVTQNYNTTTIVAGPSTLVKTGYTFSGWNTAADGTGTAYAAGSTFTFTANTTLYAQWTINTYTLTYDGNTNTGGTAPASVTQDYNTTISVAGQGTLVKTGYSFTGWNTAADGTGTPYAAGSTFTFTANTTLYAQWAVITYTITASAGPNGTINPGGATTVNYGSNQTYTFTPDVNYTIQQVLVDGVNDAAAVSSGTYTFTNVTADHTISVSFFLSTCPNPATANAGPDGSVCSNASYTLAGSIGGGATTATWTTSGTGTFSPNATYTGSGNTTYTPSAADSAAGSVTITLTTDDPNPGVCGVAADNMVLTINPLPTATVVADNLYACAGSGGSFTITGTPNSTVFYMLSPGGSSSATLDGSGSATVTLGFISANTTITLTSVVADVTNCTSTPAGAGSTATITAAPLPVAEDLTGGGNYCSGVTGVPVGLSSSQSGVSYQLQVNDGTTTSPVGSPVAGTGSALSFGNQTIVGTYSVVAINTTTGCVRNGGGATVMVGLYTEATITTDATPTTQTVCQNGTPTDLTVTAVGNNLVYQWYRNTTSSTTGGTAVGGNSSSYTPVTTATGTLYYYVTVTGPCRTVTSQIDTVTVTSSTTITGQPASASYCPNTTATALSVTASGTGTLSYQWFSNTTNITTGGTQVSTSATYTPPTTTVGTIYYYVVVSSSCGSTTSNTATVVVNAPPTVTASSNCANTFGGPVTLTATATAGSGTITGYQWNLGGTAISGATSSTYTTSNTGSYTVTVTNSNGCTATSAPVVIGTATGALTAGTYTIGGTGCNNFPTIASAVTYLNTNGITGTGGVIFNVPAGYIEPPITATITLTATGTATNGITFQKSGSGTNPKVTAYANTSGTATQATANPDGIWALSGSDYVTIDGIDLAENSVNITAGTPGPLMEYGFGLFKASTTDGAQYNTIKNSTITLSRLNVTGSATNPNADGSTGIEVINGTKAAPNTALTTTTAAAGNSYNKFYANTIQTVNNGIWLFGYGAGSLTDGVDVGNDVGGTAASTGNTIKNYGSTGVTAGIRAQQEYTFNASYNTINNNDGGGANATNTLRGIYTNTAVNASETVNNNTITLSGGGTTTIVTGIENAAGTAGTNNTVSINNNTVVTNYSTATTGVSAGINNSGNSNVLNINGNTITTNSAATSGSNYLINQTISPVTTQNINGNTIGFNFSAVTSAVVRAINYYGGASTCTTSVSNNIFNSFTFSNSATTAGSGSVSGIYLVSGTPLNQTISGNNFNNLSIKTTGTIYLIYNLYTMPASGTRNIQNNTITTGLARTGTTSSSDFYCYYGSGSSASGTSMTFSGNSLNNITANSTGYFYGLYDFDYSSSTSAPTKNVYNNSINNLNISASSGSVYLFYAPGYATGSVIRDNSVTGLFTAAAFSIYGFYGSSGQNIDIYNNTISSATLTGAATLYGVYYAGSGTGNVYNNTVNTVTRSGAGITYSVYNGGTTANIYNNTITGITNSAAGTIYGIYTFGTTASISKNFVNTLSSLGSVHGIYVSSGTTVNVFQHGVIGSNNYSIYGLSSSGITGVVANGITVAGGTAVNVYQNSIYNVSNSSTSTTATTALVNGMQFTAGTTVNAYNNLIGNLIAPAVSYADAIRGISVTSTTASTSYNLYFNTIYLNASSTGTVFGTTGIYHTTSATATTAKLDLRNNIVVNLSTPSGTGITTALRRSSATLTNYASTSNNNLYYAGTAGSTRTILYDGATAYSTFGPASTSGTFQAAVTPRETSSFTGESLYTYSTPGSFFISLNGSDPTFLHIKNGITTQAESGGQTISGITTDYDGDTRPNSGTLPDVGADEFVGVTPAPTIALNSFYVTGTTTPGTTSQCTAKGRDVSVTVTTPAGTITSVVLNYSFNGTAQTPITMTAGTGGVYTATIPAATPANATVAWSVTATNSAAISTTYTGASYTDAPLTGITATATASPAAICTGSSTVLTGVFSKSSSGSVVGSGNSTATSYDNPFYSLWSNSQQQILIRAGELTAAGLTAGNITALSINITSGTTTMPDFSLSIAPTSLTAMTGIVSAGFSTVYSNATGYTPVVGTNTITFSTPFTWDGSSNIILKFCWGSSSSTNTVSSTAIANTTSYVCAVNAHNTTATTGSSICSNTTTYLTYSNRPQFTFTGNTAPPFTSYSWSNGTTTVGTTNPLTVTPSATTTYTVTATDANGCTITSAPGITVTVNPIPTAPTTTNSIQCGTGVPMASAGGGTNGQYRWYTVATGGTALTGETNSTLTSYSISTTTTFYVAINNGTCESNRTAVTATVTTPDAVTASASTATICLGKADTLTATQTGTTNTYTYTWTATSSNASTSGISGSVTGNPVYVTPTAVGSYTYQVTANDATSMCTTTSTVTITVSALPTTPTVTASKTKVCAGTSVTLTANDATSAYCTPTYTSYDGTDYISKVELLNATGATTLYSRTSGATAQPSYDNETSLTTTTLTAGTTYTVRVTNGSADFSESVAIFIDYNNDGLFTGTGETLLAATSVSASSTTGLVSFTVPAAAYNGKARLRVALSFSTASSCASSGFGETEDYNVTVTGGVTNPNAVTYLWSTGATTQSITVSPTATTSYTVTVSNGSGCTATSAPTTVTVASPLAGVYSVGSSNIAGEAGHYATLTAAVADYNSLCLGGAITFALTDATYSTAETFPIVISANSNASATNTLTIKPNTGVTSTITGSSASTILKLSGADYVTIDGSNNGTSSRNLTLMNTNTSTSSEIMWIASASTTDGATNNTVKNCNITGSGSTASAINAGSGNSLSTAPAEAPNSNNTIQNNSITKAGNGMFIYGYTSSPYDANWTITGNTVGSGTAASKLSYRGIFLANASNFTISNDSIVGVEDNASSAYGIDLAGSLSGGNIFNNKLTDVKSTTGATGSAAYGIYLEGSTTSSNVKVYNNFISDVTSYGGAGVEANNGNGINIYSGGGYRIYYNSISLATNQANSAGKPACVLISSNYPTTANTLSIKDNIFSNTETVGTTYGVYINNGSVAMIDSLNYNDYYVPSGNIGFLTSARATLATWKTATGKEANSVNINPQFIDATTNLHINLGNGSLNDLGNPVSGITTDIDADTRSTATPDMGADEYTPIPYDAGITALVGSYCAGTDNIVVRLKNFGTSAITSVTINWSVNGVAQTPYAWTGTLAAGDSTNVTIGTYPVTANTTYTFTASTSLPNGNVDANTLNDTYSTTLRTGLSGIYTVGTGGDFTTLTAAVAAAGSYGLCGPTTFSLTGTSYTTGETFPIVMNAIAGASSTNTLTIKPASGVTAAISGAVTSGALIKLNGADYVTIDGSNTTGGTTRNLTITNTSANTTAAVIWLGSASATDGATNNTIKNIVVKGSSRTTTFATIISGSGTTLGAAAEAANTGNTYQNDSLTTAQYGIGVVGPTAGETGTIITGNSIGATATAGKIGYRGIFVSNETGVVVSSNRIAGITSTASTTNPSGGIIVYGAISGGTITQNKISDIKNTNTLGWASYGIDLQSTTTATGLMVFNNFISDVAGYGYDFTIADNGFGITAATGGGYNLYYNTISMGTDQTDLTGYSADLYVASGVTGLKVIDNVMSNTETNDSSFAIYSLAASSAFTTIDYNDYYVSGSQILGYVGGSDRRDITAMQTGFGGNTNSLNVQPLFVSATDLHLTTCNSGLDGKGTAISGITTDIDNDTRQSPPDIGADEFTSINAVVAITLNPATAVCAGTNITLSETGGTATSWLWSTGATTQSITVTPTETTTYTVTATTGGSCAKTDATVVMVNPLPTAATITPASSTICEGTIQQLTASATATGTLFSQNFNTTARGAIPSGWVKGSSATTTATWGADTTSNAGGIKNEMKFKYGGIDENNTVYLRSPAINASAWTDLSMTFNYMLDNYNADDYVYSLKMQTSTDNITWTDRWSITPTGGNSNDIAANTVTVDLSALNSTTPVYFRFAVVGQNWGSSYWYIDNVSITGSKTAPALTWSPTAGLFTNAAGTTPYGGGSATTVYAKPDTTTTYTVTSSDGICTNTATTTVTVNASPTASISPSHHVCAGSGSGVTISSTTGGTVYYHTSTNGTEQNVVVPVNGGVTLTDVPTVTTIYTLDSVKSSAGCITFLSATSTVTVDAAPTLALTSGTGTDNQTVCRNNAIISITYSFGGSATGVTVTNLPLGVTAAPPIGTTITISGTPAASGTYTVTTTGGTCAPTSLQGTITVSPFITWTGLGSDANWNTDANWCSGSVPLSTESVIIPSGTPYDPKLLSGDVTINGLTIDAGATVDLNSNNFTTGAISGGGMIIGSLPSTMTTTATGTVNFDNANNTIHNLIVSAGTLTLGSALNIEAGTSAKPSIVTIANGAQLNTGDNLTLKSDVNGTAAIGPNLSGASYITGKVTVERYTDAAQATAPSVPRRAWRFITAPVAGQSIFDGWQEGGNLATTFGTKITGEKLDPAQAASEGFDYIGGGNHTSIKQYDSAGNAWVPLSTNSTLGTQIPIRSHQAYMLFVRGNRSVGATGASTANVRAKGTLLQGDQAVAIGTGPYTAVGNPYASTIDFGSLHAHNTGAIQDKFYLWNSHASSFGAYVLVDHNGTNGYEATPAPFATSTAQDDDAYKYIPSGSGFFVSPAANPSSTTLTISEGDKAAGSKPPVNAFRVVAATNVRQLLVNLNQKNSDTSADLADGFRVKFSGDYEGNEDDNSSIKAANFNENLGLTRGGSDLIVEARGDVKKTDTLYMKMWYVTKRNYQLQMKADNFTSAPDVHAWLIDSYLSTKQELSLSGSITTVDFAVTSDSLSWKSDRFMIVFRNNAVVLPVTLTSVKASPANGGVNVSWTVTNEVNIKQYTIEKSADGGTTYTAMGTQAAKNNRGAALTSYNGFDAAPKVGDNLYRIRIEAKDGTVTYSSVVKVTIGEDNQRIQITIYPNPVREGKVNLQMTNLKAGTYLVSIYTSGGGQTVYQRKITITLPGTTQSEELRLGNAIAQGSYQVRIADHNGAIVKETQLIVSR